VALDDFWVSEVLQGNLAYDDPLRNQPWAAYVAQGLKVCADDRLFWNDEPMLPLCIHDPGVHKPNDSSIDEVIVQAKQRNVVAAGGQRPVEEVPHV